MYILGVAWEKILIGLIAGGIVSSFSFAKGKLSEIYSERKYPLAGDYISEFEDEVNGKTILCTAPVALKQKGKKIYGETKLPNDNRSWHLEGHISEGGHIHGIYYANDPHDKGIGNFFLFINNNRFMEGLWSGYDSVNKKINSGKYIFAPVLSDYQIIDMTEDFIPSTIAISDDQLGKDYVTIDSLQQSITGDSKNFAKVAVNQKEEVIGFCVCSILTSDEIINTIRIPPIEFPNALRYSKSIGMIRVVVVKETFQRRGVGYALVCDCIEKLIKNNVTALCSVGWYSSKGVNIRGILSTLNFNEIKVVPNYWKEDSIAKKYRCRDCGEPPCECSAIIYARFR
jgi:ribosomal protein S18 acetylase RimI-like enzyme